MSDQGPKPDLGVSPAAREVGGRERVPDRPAALTLESWLKWAPKYKQQCVEDAFQAAREAGTKYLRDYFKATNG